MWTADAHYERGQRPDAIGPTTGPSASSPLHASVLRYHDAVGREKAARAARTRQLSIARLNDKAKAHSLAIYRDAQRRPAGMMPLAFGSRQVRSGTALEEPSWRRPRSSGNRRRLAVQASPQRHLGTRSRTTAPGRTVRFLVLLLNPVNAEAKDIARKAAAGEALQARLATAWAASRAHEWRRALALAFSVLHAHLDPGRGGSGEGSSRRSQAQACGRSWLQQCRNNIHGEQQRDDDQTQPRSAATAPTPGGRP